MSCLENDKIKESAWEDFLKWYDKGWINHSQSWGDYCYPIDLLTEADGTCEGTYLNADQLGDLFDNLWEWDCELLVKDKITAVKRYIMHQKSIAQLRRLSQ